MDVLTAIVHTQNPDVRDDVPVGILGLRSEAEAQPFKQQVSYNFAGGTLEEALDALVLASPGTGWMVRENRPGRPEAPGSARCEATLFSGETIVSAS